MPEGTGWSLVNIAQSRTETQWGDGATPVGREPDDILPF